MSFGTAIQNLYEKFGDEESRLIFRRRMDFMLTGNYSELFKMIEYINGKHCMTDMKKQSAPAGFFLKESGSGKRNSVYLVGYGEYVALYHKYAVSTGVEIRAWIPYPKAGDTEEILPIATMEEALAEPAPVFVIAIQNRKNATAAIMELRRKKVAPDRIIFPANDEEEYFGADIPGFLPPVGGIYIDGGVFDGKTILRYVEWTGGKYDKIYGFEPDPINYPKVEACIRDKNLKNTEVFNKGLWNKRDRIAFETSGTAGSKICSKGEDSVQVEALDNILEAGEKVAFVKLDIEGAEMEALEGMKDMILRDKPMLAICVYHKAEDIIDIPAYISALVPEYKLYLRHHSQLEYETVLYAFL